MSRHAGGFWAGCHSLWFITRLASPNRFHWHYPRAFLPFSHESMIASNRGGGEASLDSAVAISGGVFQCVPPGNVAPSGSRRSSHGCPSRRFQRWAHRDSNPVTSVEPSRRVTRVVPDAPRNSSRTGSILWVAPRDYASLGPNAITP